MVKLHMAQSVSKAVEFVEQGHVKVGVDTITDPAFHVNRAMEDHIGWVKTSKIRKKIIEYTGDGFGMANGGYDDYDINA